MPDFDHALWKKRIDADESFQAQRHQAWKTSLSLYDMSFWRERGFSSSLVSDAITPVNYATTFVSTLVSAIYSRNPKIFVRARHERFARFAETMEDLLERFWDEQDLKSVFIEVIRDTIIFGIGWFEVGYLPPDLSTLPQKPDATETLKDAVQQFLGETQSSPKPPAPVSTQGILNVHQEAGEFYCVRRRPYDVLWPAGFHTYAELPYLTLRDRLRKEDFLNHPRYKNTEYLQTTQLKERPWQRLVPVDFSNLKSQRAGATAPNDLEVIDVYHIWDRREMTVTTMTKKSPLPHDGPDDWPYLSAGFPAIPLMFNSVPDKPDQANAYPFSDVEPIIAQVIEKSNIRSAMVQHRKRANAVVFVQKGGSTAAEVSNYARASDAVDVVPVSNIQAIQLGPQIQIPPALFQTEESINSDLDRDSGLQLILADLARTAQIDRATVATIAQGNASLKTSYKVDRVEAVAKQIALYQVGLFWQFLTRAEVGEVIGIAPDADQWIDLPDDSTVARKRVKKELELRIEAGSTRPIQDDVLDREQFLRYIRIFQAVSPQKFVQVENQLLALMAKKFREPALENVIQQAINQDHAQEAQQENQLLLQGFPQVVRMSDDHDAHLAVHAQAASSPVHKLQAEQAAAQGHAHPLDSHLLQHAQMKQGQQATTQGQRRNRQGVSQESQAPSATELGRSGMPSHTDVAGRVFNLGAGTGSESMGL